MRATRFFSTRVRLAAGVLVVLGAVTGCSESKEPTAVRTTAVRPAVAAATDCGGAYDCQVPNPNPCEAAGQANSGLLAHPGDPTDCTFAIKPQTVLYDGAGTPLATITDAQVRIFYGQQKWLTDGGVDPGDGLLHADGKPAGVAVLVSRAGTTVGAASGWMFESSLTEPISYMAAVNASDPGKGDYVTNWLLTGGTPEVRAGYAEMVFADGNSPDDYLGQPDSVVSMLYNLPGMGGVQDDGYRSDNAVLFQRSKGVVLASVPYYTRGAPAGAAPAGYMQFMYGHIGDRYGWVSRDGAVAATACAGAHDCKLPNPHPCKATNGGGSNRLAHPDNPYDCTFAIAPGTIMYDGMGNPRDTIISTQVKINYGQRKLLPDGTQVVYAWDATTTAGHESGWIHESSVTESLAFMPTVVDSNPGDGDYPRSWTLTGGSAEVRAAYDGMVLCADQRPCGSHPTDYLLRPGGVVNVLYSLPAMGGVSNDTYLVTGRAVSFQRSEGVSTMKIPYYDGNSPAGSGPAGYMEFMYGHVGDRYGWVAVDATSTVATDVP